MDEKTKKSLTEIINYLYRDEKKHHEESEGDEHHIFTDIQRVAEWLDNNK